MARLSTQCPALVLALLLLVSATLSLTPPGTIERTTKQQILGTLPPATDGGGSELFLSSPSGKFQGYLLRRSTAPGAGGFGNDFCYIQIVEGEKSVWESECAAVSTANACALVFSDAGLEIFDGSRSTWDSDADGEELETLVMVDSGDMQIRDRDGELAWRASDNPLTGQECGSVGSPGLNAAHAPFAHPIGDRTVFGQPDDDHHGPATTTAGTVGTAGIAGTAGAGFTPFGSSVSGLNQQQQTFGANGEEQPLVDNNPYDSASSSLSPSSLLLLLLLLLAVVGLF